MTAGPRSAARFAALARRAMEWSPDSAKLMRAGGLLFIANVAGGALGYAYQVLVGRLLPPADYGALSSMMAIYTVLAVPVSAASLHLARRLAQLRAGGEAGAMRRLMVKAWRRTALACMAVLIAYALAFPAVRGWSGMGPLDAAAFGAMAALMILTAPNAGFFQAMQSTLWLSVMGILGHAGKAVFGTLLVALGFGIAGAFAGVSVATISMLVVGTWAAHRLTSRVHGSTAGRVVATSADSGSAATILIASLAFAMMSQLDVAIVKGYYPPAQAGAYAAAAVLGKAILYLPAALVVPLFPMVVHNDTLQRSSLVLLMQALGASFLITAGGTLVYFVTGSWLVNLLFGAAYREAGPVLELYGLAMMPMALIMVLEHFLLAKGRAFFAYSLLVAAPLQWLLVRAHHGSLLDALNVVIVSGWGLLVLGIAWLAWIALASGGRR